MTLLRCVVAGLVAGVIAAAGLVPGAVVPARAGVYCNIYVPSRIAIWQQVQSYEVRFGAGCEASGTRNAGWIARYQGIEDVALAVVGWERGDDFGVGLGVPDHAPTGLTRWEPLGADPEGLTQNEPSTTVKLGAISYVSVTRTGEYHAVTARAYHYSASAHAIVPSGRRPGQVQFRTPGSSTWRPVSGVTVGADGRVTIRTWSPEPRYYRVSFGEQPTLWNTVSEEVRAR